MNQRPNASSTVGGHGHHNEAQGDLSEAESDTSSIDISMKPPSPASREQLVKRMESLLQENRVLKVELDAFKIKVKTLQVENKQLKETSFQMQAKAEQEEEFISNTLLKKIQELKKEKEALALNYEQEEEFLTNDLTKKLTKLRQEKAELTTSLHEEQESMVSKLIRRIKKLEADTNAKQQHLEQLRREKVELENTLEQEQEALVNRLWKRMENLEHEKQYLQRKLDQPATAPPSPMDLCGPAPATVLGQCANPVADQSVPPPIPDTNSSPLSLAKDIIRLRGEVMQLKQRLRISQAENSEKMAQITREEQHIREENSRLQKQLQIEIERREQLCQYLSESESSLDVEMDFSLQQQHQNSVSPHLMLNTMRPISPASPATTKVQSTKNGGEPAPKSSAMRRPMPAVGYCRCPSCGYQIQGFEPLPETRQLKFRTGKFARPVNPAPVSPRIRSESLPGSSAGSNDEISPKKP